MSLRNAYEESTALIVSEELLMVGPGGYFSPHHGGQGESLVPRYTRGTVGLPHGGMAKAWCLRLHAEASLRLAELAQNVIGCHPTHETWVHSEP